MRILLLALLLAPALLSAQTRPVITVLDYAEKSGPDRENTENVWRTVRKLVPEVDIRVASRFSEDYHKVVEALGQSGKLPDVLFCWPGGRSSFLYERHLLKDLRTLLTPEELASFSPSAVDPLLFQGYVGELPVGLTATHVLFVNTRLLASVGLTPARTYEELRQQAPLLAAQGLMPVLMPNRDDWVMQGTLFSALLARLGGAQYVNDLRRGTARLDEGPFLEALRFVQRLYRDGVLPAQSLTTDYGEAPVLFADGRSPYYIDGGWRVQAFLTDPETGSVILPVDEQASILVTVFPTIPGERPDAPRSSFIPGTGYGINAAIPAGSDKERAALAVVRALQSREVQRLRLQAGSAYPSRIDVEADLEPLAQAHLSFLRTQTGGPLFDSAFPPEVFELVSQGMRQIGLGETTPEQVAAQAQAAFEKFSLGPAW